jgi:hypothetical protein
VAILKREDAKKLRHSLRSAFQIYMIDCATPAPTGTQRRKELRKIRAAARRLAAHPNWRAADGLLKALDTPDLDARIVAYKVLTAKGYTPFQFKRTLRHWTITSSAESSDIAAANELASLDIQALAPAGGRFPDPGLAHLVASLIPIWTVVTGRTAGLVSVDVVDNVKRCPFAEWLNAMHQRLGVAQPPLGRVVDIGRWVKRSKNPAPVQGNAI